MDHVGILKRAYRIAAKYPILWVFGFFGAAGTTVGGNFSAPWNVFNYNRRVPRTRGGDFYRIYTMLGNDYLSKYLPIILGVVAVLLLLFLIWLVIHFVARTGFYRMVFDLEETGERPTWSRGWRLGWDVRAIHVFLVDLIVMLAMVLIIMTLVLLGAALVIAFHPFRNPSFWLIAVTVVVILAAILALVVISIVISLTAMLAAIHAAVTGENALVSLEWGWDTLRREWKDIGIMWLLMLGVGLLIGILELIAVLILALVTLIVAVGPGWLIWRSTGNLVLSIAVGGVIGLVSFFLPMLVVDAAFRTYVESVWTLVYREVAVEPAEATEVAPA